MSSCRRGLLADFLFQVAWMFASNFDVAMQSWFLDLVERLETLFQRQLKKKYTSFY